MGGVNHPQMAGLWHWVSHMNDLMSDHSCSKIWWDVYHLRFYPHSCRNFELWVIGLTCCLLFHSAWNDDPSGLFSDWLKPRN